MKKRVSIIVAVDDKDGIGKEGKIPWRDPVDMKYFQQLTTKTSNPDKQNAIIMGSKTAISLPVYPLPNRLNIILDRTTTLNKIFSELDKNDNIEKIFVIGGQVIYDLALQSTRCQYISISHIKGDYKCDRFFKFDKTEWELYDTTDNTSFYYRTNKGELQYLDLVSKILKEGTSVIDRTTIGTKYVFGEMMRFNLRNNTLPLLTTRRIWFKGVMEELFWIISGCTDAKVLAAKGVHIWDGNSSREALDKVGLKDYEVGDCGPIYGFQMRHYGAEYKNCHTDYKGQGKDQLQECINMIKTKPNSRQIIIDLWNPSQTNRMCLPPCHILYQFNVNIERKELSCKLSQRSGDMGLGVPFNIASASLLTHMIARVCGLTAGDFVHDIGNAHIYNNHVEALTKQLHNKPFMFPKIVFNRSVDNIDDFHTNDISLVGYNHYDDLQMPMAV